MYKFIFAAALVAIAMPAAAEKPQTVASDFKADGLAYHFVREDRDGYSVVRGTDSNGTRFNLRIVGDRVSGRYGRTPVRFMSPAAMPTTIAMK